MNHFSIGKLKELLMYKRNMNGANHVFKGTNWNSNLKRQGRGFISTKKEKWKDLAIPLTFPFNV